MKVWIVMSIYDDYDAEWQFRGAFSTRKKAIEFVRRDFADRFEDDDINTDYDPNKYFYNFGTSGCIDYEVFEANVE